MEIQIGEYVRTKDGEIIKLENNEEFFEDSVDVGIGIMPAVDGIWIDKEYFDYIEKKEVAKHSFHIIDLIEVGDYVNGEYICDITECLNENRKREKAVVINEMGYNEYAESLFNKDIKSIVTKEQFKQVEYKVED